MSIGLFCTRAQTWRVACSAAFLCTSLALHPASAAMDLWGAPNVDTAPGFGRDVTGGFVPGAAKQNIVTVTTAKELEKALCAYPIGDRICDNSKDKPRIIRIKGIINYNRSALSKFLPSKGCYFADEASCTVRGVPKTQWPKIVDRGNGYCNGRSAITPVHDDRSAVEPTANQPLVWNQLPALLVGSNKTIIGVGPKSGIKGRSLGIWSQKNVIVRNLTITDINEDIVFAGDGIEVSNSNRVWIDHNKFARIGRQWLTVSNERAGNITISNNDFDGRGMGYACDGDHYWGLIVSGEGEKVTIVGNWMHNFSGRTPDIAPPNQGDIAAVHLVNNLFEISHGHGMEPGVASRILMEGNVYYNVRVPINKYVNQKAGALQ